MNTYLDKTSKDIFRNKLRDFYTMEVGEFKRLSFEEIIVPITFLRKARSSNLEGLMVTDVRLLHKWDYYKMISDSFQGKECHVRLYEVHAPKNYNKYPSSMRNKTNSNYPN